MSVTACVPDMTLLRAASCRAGTTAGRKVELPMSNSTVAEPVTSAANTRCGYVSVPIHQASGSDPSAANRTRSSVTWSRRSGTRCARTPAGRLSSSQETCPAAASRATWKAVASRTVRATSGRARTVTAVPAPLTVAAAQ